MCIRDSGEPIDGGPQLEGEDVEIGGPSVNPVRRDQPSELIATGIAGIDQMCIRDSSLPDDKGGSRRLRLYCHYIAEQ